MSEEQPSYKVTDRRLFNADGTPRDLPEPEKPEAAAAAKTEAPTPTPAAPDTQSTPAADTAGEPEASAPEPAQSTADEATMHAEEPPEMDLPGAEEPASFVNFMMSIASNAAASLGMMEHPTTGKREVDLELGKHWIDILGMLQKKTSGNLLPQEQQILEGLLADLRMQFVSLTNATPKARSFSSRDITGG